MNAAREPGPSLPPPGLVHLADFSITVAPPRIIGEAGACGRRFVAILGGTVRGSRLSCTILPGGSDDQRVGVDGVVHIHARYLIETADGTILHLESTGLRGTPPEMARQARPGETPVPAATYFVTTLRFETAAPGYLWMGRRLFVANGERRDGQVFLSVFEVVA